jgi:cadmium resistance protein CadD (predicted permease)
MNIIYFIGLTATLIVLIILGCSAYKKDGKLGISVGEFLMILSLIGASWFGLTILLLASFQDMLWWNISLFTLKRKNKDVETQD